MTRRLPYLLALAPILATTPLSAQITARPVIVEVVADESASAKQVWIRNDGADAQPVRIYAGDFDQRHNGDHLFADLGAHSRSCDGRITVFPDGATLAPGEQIEVMVRVAPADDVCWSMVFIEAAPSDLRNITIAHRIGVKVYGVPAEAPRSAHITGSAVEEGPAGPTLRFQMTNDGQAPLRPRGHVEIRAMDGAEIERVTIPAFSVLPGYDREHTLDLGPMEPGRYVAVVVLDISASFLIGDRVEFELR